jgi:hypothetical protein
MDRPARGTHTRMIDLSGRKIGTTATYYASWP